MPAPGKIDRTTLSYVALVALNVNGSIRNVGDAVPEAAGWKNLHSYIASGQIAIVNEATANPSVRQDKMAFTQKTKAAGNAPFTHYRPTDPFLNPASVPVDEA